MEDSASALRNSLRHHQSQDAHLSLLHQLASDCFQHGWSSEVGNRLLSQLCANLGITQAFIAQQQLNVLTVIASVGDSYPQGARIPMMGRLASALTSPCNFTIHEDLLVVSPSQTATMRTLTLPIACQQKLLGSLIIAQPSLPLSDQQIQLCETICGLLGCTFYQTHQQAQQQDISSIDVLTPREREVFALLPSGKSNAELATVLGIAAGTVKIHVERILNKLQLKDRTQAAVKAVELGFSSGNRS